MDIHGDITNESSVYFSRRLRLASPIKISKLLTDSVSQFTDRFSTKDNKPSDHHTFDHACTSMDNEHRLSPPRHPRTDGMVERFNGNINELLQQTRFDSRAALKKSMQSYLKLYKHHIPHRAIETRTLIQAQRLVDNGSNSPTVLRLRTKTPATGMQSALSVQLFLPSIAY